MKPGLILAIMFYIVIKCAGKYARDQYFKKENEKFDRFMKEQERIKAWRKYTLTPEYTAILEQKLKEEEAMKKRAKEFCPGGARYEEVQKILREAKKKEQDKQA